MRNQLTEQDLRRALQSLAPEDIDATQFRGRLDRLLASRPQVSSDSDEATQLSLDWPEPHSRSRTRRRDLAIAVALAACAAAVIAVVVAVVSPGHSERHPSTPALNDPDSAVIQSMFLPGTIVLDSYRGRGSQTFLVPPRVIPPHYVYAAYGTCSGAGTIHVGQTTVVCANAGGGYGTSDPVQNGRLVITADDTLGWQITLLLAPDPQTNGMVGKPVDDDLTGPNNAVRQSGHGSGTVLFTGATLIPPVDSRYRLALVCHGSGVTLPNLTTPDASGLHTKTCYDGYEYVWDDVTLNLPVRIRVEAAAGTTWTLAIKVN